MCGNRSGSETLMLSSRIFRNLAAHQPSVPLNSAGDILVDGFEGAHETEIVLQFDGDDLLRERFKDTVKGQEGCEMSYA
jgi:hypothetical protein